MSEVEEAVLAERAACQDCVALFVELGRLRGLGLWDGPEADEVRDKLDYHFHRRHDFYVAVSWAVARAEQWAADAERWRCVAVAPLAAESECKCTAFECDGCKRNALRAQIVASIRARGKDAFPRNLVPDGPEGRGQEPPVPGRPPGPGGREQAGP